MKKYTITVLSNFRGSLTPIFWRVESPDRDTAFGEAHRRLEHLRGLIVPGSAESYQYLTMSEGWHYDMYRTTPQDVYERYEAIVLPHLQFYKEDVTNIDNAILLRHGGPFLATYRRNGSHLFTFGPIRKHYVCDSATTLEIAVRRTFERKRAEVEYNFYDEPRYLYFDGVEFLHVEKERALAICDEWLAVALQEVIDETVTA